MPESKADRALRARSEIANFCDCGDARGRAWLAAHPEARPRAETLLHDLSEHLHPHEPDTSLV